MSNFRTGERKDGSKYHFPVSGRSNYERPEMEMQKVNLSNSINWDLEATERMIANQRSDLIARASIVWMSPDEFLSNCPAVGTTSRSAKDMLEWDYDSGSLNALRKRIENGQKMEILFLDYSRMWHGFPSHEGRHRAFIAKQMGIEKIPVTVVKNVEENSGVLSRHEKQVLNFRKKYPNWDPETSSFV